MFKEINRLKLLNDIKGVVISRQDPTQLSSCTRESYHMFDIIITGYYFHLNIGIFSPCIPSSLRIFKIFFI